MASASLTRIPALFEPGAAPPTLPIPLAQTELVDNQGPSLLLAQQDIGTSTIISRFRSRSRSLSVGPPMKTGPPLKGITFRRVTFATSPKPGTISLPEFDSDDEELSEVSSTDEPSLIPKLEGEAGRPGRGGYNLQAALGWSKKDYAQLKKPVSQLVADHLEITKVYSEQSLALICIVEDKVLKKFPNLAGYAGLWPITDMVRLQLKYIRARQRTREREHRLAAGKRVTRESTRLSETRLTPT